MRYALSPGRHAVEPNKGYVKFPRRGMAQKGLMATIAQKGPKLPFLSPGIFAGTGQSVHNLHQLLSLTTTKQRSLTMDSVAMPSCVPFVTVIGVWMLFLAFLPASGQGEAPLCKGPHKRSNEIGKLASYRTFPPVGPTPSFGTAR